MEQPSNHLHRLDHLIREGVQLRAALAAEPASPLHLEQLRVWQRECGATIGQLSGGSKAHWLSRAYSEAYLLSGAKTEVSASEIVLRILNVLEQAVASLRRPGQEGFEAPSDAAPSAGRRFNFVHDKALRPSLEQTYAESRRAQERGEFALALVAACSVLEAVVTDALEHAGPATLAGLEAPDGLIGGWSFEARVAFAEKARLISNGCARLPDDARRYRSLLDEKGELLPGVSVSEGDARRTAQVLIVILRDLEPGR